MRIVPTVRAWARRLQRDAITLWFAWRSSATLLAVRALCVFVVTWALSPIDLVPDFIPALGCLDDALLLPGLIWLAVRLLPPPVLAESRSRAETWMADKGQRTSSRAGAVAIVLIWVAVACAVWRGFAS